MDDIKTILIGLLVFVITSVIAYLFKMRQLYVSIPRLYNKSNLSSSGSLCEIRIFNRGNHPEEDIAIAFAPELNIELLATDSAELSISNNKLQIPRVHKFKDVSALLMVEGGAFEHSKISSFSSKAVTGRILKPNEDTPPNWAIVFTFMVLFLSVFPSLFYGFDFYREYKTSSEVAAQQKELSGLMDVGWSNLGRYYKSPIRKSYTNKEFPVLIKGTSVGRDGSEYLNFEVVNKTGLTINVYVDAKGYESKVDQDIAYWANVKADPLTAKSGVVKLPKSKGVGSSLNVVFSFGSDDDYVNELVYELKRRL
ncbi:MULTISPECIES: hypothetical protein [Pseudomonas]|uniref:hypothetical protein n=1 Tax=Pseudomonas TaxID=286 RepID=UPI0025705B97|nr:hypothetical protein [Pseudomonas asiatica]WJD69220.1 hypothetical protein QQ994_21785 [Pseudomonas asiatica]